MKAGANDLAERFACEMDALLGGAVPEHLGVAVSGGGDSMALLHLAVGWAQERKVAVWAVTVDHGLRRESGEEAAFVTRVARRLGVPHAIMRWDRKDAPEGNLQAAARRARIALIDRWRGVIRHVLTGHTLDDQAETFLMRLRRGSGVDGLAGIPPRRTIHSATRGQADPSGDEVPPRAAEPSADFEILRPLLHFRRAELRAYLTALGETWCEDPSNRDMRFERVRMRSLLQRLEPEGLGAERLAGTAAAMARARVALALRALELSERLVRVEAGDVIIAPALFHEVESETRLRILAEAIRFVASPEYRPRLASLEGVARQLAEGRGATLGGCHFLPMAGGAVRVIREFAALSGVEARIEGPTRWDGRWVIGGKAIEGMTVRALGPEGAAALPERPDALPFQSLIAQPAVFDGERLVACQAAGFGPAHELRLDPPGGDFGAQWRTLK